MAKLPSVTVNLDVSTGTDPRASKPEADTPFRLLLMGDFSGRANRGEPAPSRWKPLLIDRDNFDAVLARIRPELALGGSSHRIVMQFRELDDFLPDRIYEQCPIFEELRETRRKLRNPATFAQAAAAVKQWTGTAATPAPSAPLPQKTGPTPVSAPAGGSLLENILAATQPEPAQVRHQPDDLHAFIQNTLGGHVTPGPDPELPELLAQLDAAASRLMRAILHDPNFQALEAGWRAVFWLVRGLETGPQLKLHILDVSKADVAADLNASEDPRSTAFYQLLVEPNTGVAPSEPWAVVASNFTFARTAEDARTLQRLARLTRAAGAPFLAEAGLADFDSTDAARIWNALRQAPEASWIGLLLPRFLLRLPYGSKTDPLESFSFEEMPGTPVHQHYLWGNPAFACAYLLARSFSDEGWDLRPGVHSEIGGLPLHVYEVDAEQEAKPCAEMLMSERDADWVLEQGFMPLASVKNQDSIRLLRFQSIAEPLTPLSCRWR